MKQSLHKTSTAGLLLRYRDLRLVLPARTLSALGDQVTLIVLLLHVAEVGGPMHATVLLAAFALPLFALAPLAGRIVDEYDSRTVLICAAAVQAIASAGLVLSQGFASMIGAVLVLQAGQAVALPAWSALTPRIVHEHDIGVTVGLMQSLWAAAGLGGAALGGVLYAVVGYHETLLVDTATFAIIAVAGALVRTRRGRRHDVRTGLLDPGAATDPVPGGGWSYLRGDALLRLLVPALCLVVLSAEAMNVMEVFLIRDAMGASAQLFGLATGVMLLGAIGGPLLAGRIRSDRSRLTYAAAATAVVGLLVAATGLAPTVWYALPLLLGTGYGVGLLNAAIGAVVVARPPERIRGRTQATMNGALRGCSVFAMVLGGLAGQLLGARGTYVICGLLTASVAGLILRSRRGLDVRSPGADDRSARESVAQHGS